MSLRRRLKFLLRLILAAAVAVAVAFTFLRRKAITAGPSERRPAEPLQGKREKLLPLVLYDEPRPVPVELRLVLPVQVEVALAAPVAGLVQTLVAVEVDAGAGGRRAFLGILLPGEVLVVPLRVFLRVGRVGVGFGVGVGADGVEDDVRHDVRLLGGRLPVLVLLFFLLRRRRRRVVRIRAAFEVADALLLDAVVLVGVGRRFFASALLRVRADGAVRAEEAETAVAVAAVGPAKLEESSPASFPRRVAGAAAVLAVAGGVEAVEVETADVASVVCGFFVVLAVGDAEELEVLLPSRMVLPSGR
mmetsp:Transcript_9395/g.17621  ORF Transcript_9395/g.17621 Transcript_9395/m.17621 type:complete len:304 (-) Transcript_9395:93-1004(-)